MIRIAALSLAILLAPVLGHEGGMAGSRDAKRPLNLDPATIAAAVARAHADQLGVQAAAARTTPGCEGVYVGLRHDGELIGETWSFPRTSGSTDSSLVHEAIAMAAGASADCSVDAIEVCLAHNTRDANPRSLRNDEARRGVLGVELQVAGETRRYAPTTMIARNLGFDDLLERDSSAPARIFDATQFLVLKRDRPGRAMDWQSRGGTGDSESFELHLMFRGNEIVEMSDLSEERIRELARTMGDWLARQVHEDGRMTYKYWPSRKRESGANNLIRQFMATQCLSRLVAHATPSRTQTMEQAMAANGRNGLPGAEITLNGVPGAEVTLNGLPNAEVTPNGAPAAEVTPLAELAARNLRYNIERFYREQVVPRPRAVTAEDATDTLGFVVEPDGEVKLGAIALAALAIHDNPARDEFRREERALQRTLDALWRPDGSFQTFYRPATRTDGANFYPGEALLYWAELLADGENPASIQTDATRGEAGTGHSAQYERSTRDQSELLERFWTSVRYYREWHLAHRNPAFVPWHTQACFIVWRKSRDPFLAEWIFEMNDWLLEMQQWDEAPYADMRGRFYAPGCNYGPPHASSTGVYLEGLADAFVLAGELNDEPRRESYRTALVRGIRNVAQLQFADDVDMFYVVDRAAVQGGLRTTEYDNEIRVDNVQHVLMALLDVLDAFAPDDLTRPLSPVPGEGMDSTLTDAPELLRTALRPPIPGAAVRVGATARSDPSLASPDSPS